MSQSIYIVVFRSSPSAERSVCAFTDEEEASAYASELEVRHNRYRENLRRWHAQDWIHDPAERNRFRASMGEKLEDAWKSVREMDPEAYRIPSLKAEEGYTVKTLPLNPTITPSSV